MGHDAIGLRRLLCGIALLVSLVAMGTNRAEAVVPDGACCQPSGECVTTIEMNCGGTYVGDGVSCASIQCDPRVAVPVLSVLGFVGTIGALAGLGLFQLVRRRQRI